MDVSDLLCESNISCSEVLTGICLFGWFLQLNLLIWPRFKLVFDMHLGSIRSATVRTLWEDDVRPHYVTRRYAEFSASLLYLNKDYGDGQVVRIAATFSFRSRDKIEEIWFLE